METEQKQHNLIEVVQYCQVNDLPARVVGRWVWIKFEAKPAADIRQGLKDFGFRWSKRRGQWAHNCGHTSKPAHSYRPWDKYQTRALDDVKVGA